MSQFKHAKQNRVWWPVTVRVPVDGGTKKVDGEVLVTVATRTESQKLLDAVGEDFESAIARLFHDWRGDAFMGEDNSVHPFSAENLIALMEFRFFESALSNALREASMGAATKNS